MEENDIDEVIERLKAKGYTLTFNPEDSNAASWGVSDPWPSGIGFDIDEIVPCRGSDGEPLRIFAVTTKPFGLKGIWILSGEGQRYWTVEEIMKGFAKVLRAVFLFMFKRQNKLP
ncbi:hypothetical protein ASU31_25175 [Pedobacter ginsenosidimutans]|uniref:Uncharacterized protein n=1 Tax=Pedobacter ginsenosidimutans TaxID=687842 RepID=A0A0T5VHJ5_9SPHI|nr:hypothetical protein [Pedobacter ginsenosidimutans]KRT13307.1 hypothetical protein ASU31_25175 [Pedobacter ginsenosidimutans]